MQSFKEKGRKPVSNDAFKLYNIYRRLYGWWQLWPPSHTNVCKFDLFQKGISSSIFNILLSYLPFLLIVPVFQFFVFSFAKLTIKFSIIYDNA